MSELERIGGDARRELARFEPAPGLAELIAVWPEAVGREIASNAWPARLGRDGVLHVATSSSAWAFELTHLESEMLERLRGKAGESVPKKLRFAPGPLPTPGPARAQGSSRDRLVASAKARRQAASITAGIDNEDLRETVARAAAVSLERAASDRSV